MVKKIESHGWKQISKKVWVGAYITDPIFPTNQQRRAKIRIKKATKRARDQRLRIQIFTSFGHESDRANTLEEALEIVKWFMKKRPQNVKDAYRTQGFRMLIQKQG